MRMVKHAKVFRIGNDRTIEIPAEFDFAGDEVLITKTSEGRIVIQPVEQKPDLFEWLDSLEPLEEEFPNVDENLGPPDEVNL